jgi:hypothetical protein
MQNPVPAPRLPIEPDPRPIYRPPARLGCSGMALVSLVTLIAFLLFFAVITPQLIDRARSISLPEVLGLTRPTPTVAADATPDSTPGTPTDPATRPPTPLPTPVPATATPEPEYVAIGNSSGDNVSLRAEPHADAAKLIALRPGTVLLVAGADVTTDGKLWRNVRTTAADALTGWVMAQYLVPSGPP